MTFEQFLRQKQNEIVERWLDKSLAAYSADGAAFFRRQKDPFLNPVGEAFRVGTRAVFENLLDGLDPDEACRHLHGIVKIQSVQELSPSRAVSFVFLLKQAVREELGPELERPGRWSELLAFEAQIDQLALFAFDIYVRCREQVYQLRVNEVKRSVSTLLRRNGKGGAEPEPEPDPQHDEVDSS